MRQYVQGSQGIEFRDVELVGANKLLALLAGGWREHVFLVDDFDGASAFPRAPGQTCAVALVSWKGKRHKYTINRYMTQYIYTYTYIHIYIYIYIYFFVCVIISVAIITIVMFVLVFYDSTSAARSWRVSLGCAVPQSMGMHMDKHAFVTHMYQRRRIYNGQIMYLTDAANWAVLFRMQFGVFDICASPNHASPSGPHGFINALLFFAGLQCGWFARAWNRFPHLEFIDFAWGHAWIVSVSLAAFCELIVLLLFSARGFFVRCCLQLSMPFVVVCRFPR